MKERELRRLLTRLLTLSTPLPLALLGAACGGTALDADPAGAAGRYSASGAPNGGAAGALGIAGSGVGGSSAGSGVGGSSAGSGQAGAAMGGAGAVAGASTGGAGGSNECSGTSTLLECGSSQITLPKPCVDAAMQQVGTTLPGATCLAICEVHGSALTCAIGAVDAESVTVKCTSGCFTGRRPAGLGIPQSLDASGVAAYFASVARLEAASVDAFRILQDELRAHGAPKKLVRAAARAARDEIRHTRATSALARRFGARLSSVAIERTPLRSLEAMAIENAVEGCVRETYGALLATWQARAARDPLVRAALMRIARDETRHSALSWSVGRWLETRLDAKAKRQVEIAKQAAARELLSSTLHEAEASFADVVGLPSPAQAAQLAREMQRTLWS